MSKNQNHSSYWMDDDMWDDEDDILPRSKEEVSLHRITKLSATRRAISNFVNILTGRNDIPVKFSSGKGSYTTGDSVVIAADDNPENFDTMVGLALHEGSHILLSDFKFITAVDDIQKQIARYDADFYWNGVALSQIRNPTLAGNGTTLRTICHPLLAKLLPVLDASKGYTREEVNKYRGRARRYVTDLLDIMNILEDRRIDQYVYRNAGGYRPYYDAMYKKYFLNAEIGRNLRWNPEWRELTVENYKDRLLFAIHPDSNPDSMPGLRKLIEIMDLARIDRIVPDRLELWKKRASYDSMPVIWQVANEIYVHILRFVALAEKNKIQIKLPSNQSSSSSSTGSGSGSPTTPETTDESESTENDSTQKSEPFNEFQPTPDEVENATSHLPNLDTPSSEFVEKDVDKPDTTKSGKEKPTKFNDSRGKKAVKTAKEVMAGKLKKKKASKKEIDAADALEKADARMVDIKGDGIPGGQCMVTRRMSNQLFNESWFIFGDNYQRTYKHHNDARQKSLAAGRRMGAILETRLQVRNDPVFTKNTRLQQGSLDRRLLANLGMDIINVFQKSRVDTFKPAMLHLTLDASGSMNGLKWEKVITVATALAYVGSKVRNIDTVISIRGGNDIPVVSVVFDSRKDKFPSWMKWGARLYPNGATPEGLCYKATMELITECANTHDVYFINFSDGEPGFTIHTNNGKSPRRRWAPGNYCSYGGDLAFKHTRQQVQAMRDKGIKVLSYFITDSNNYYTSAEYLKRSMENFRSMYGEDAVNVNVQNASEVLRTLNKLLLERV